MDASAPPAHAAPPVTREVIDAALAGDRRAMTALIWAILPPIKVEVARCLGRQAALRRRDARQDLEDFSHEIVVHLLREGGKLLRMWDPARGHGLPGFVRMIARRWISRVLQGHRHNPWGDEPTSDESLEPLLDADHGDRRIESREELRALLERLRARLNERGLILFQRIFVEQRPIVEVAAELGMTREAVDAWNTRTRQLVRALAQGEPRGGGP